MFEFVLMVVLANAIMLACLYILRHVIAIRAPVLFIAVGISIFYCILYPFLVSRVPYPKVLYLYGLLIMIGAALLYIIETRFFSVEEEEVDALALCASQVVAAHLPGKYGAEEIIEVQDDLEEISTDEPRGEGEAQSEECIPPVSLYMLEILDEVVIGEESDKPGITRDAMTILDVVDEVATVEEAITSSDRDYADGGAVLQDYPGNLLKETEKVITEEQWELEGTAGDISGGETRDEQEWVGDSQISIMVARAFDSLASGDSAGAVEDFFRVLRMEPPPKLAVMLCIEISSIYLARGHKGQSLAVLEMLDVVWGHALDPGDAQEVKTKIKRLEGEI
ncbi:MAG: hypothetical protein VR68_03535 [Peptococcaceae bacterium BRH_c4a]|nr:MAG: hypothetical protein VR68_03535 [Peptococcaceae bacterium BRH_c4a]